MGLRHRGLGHPLGHTGLVDRATCDIVERGQCLGVRFLGPGDGVLKRREGRAGLTALDRVGERLLRGLQSAGRTGAVVVAGERRRLL